MANQTRTNKRTGEVQALRNGQWITIQPGTAQPSFGPGIIPLGDPDPLKEGQQVKQGLDIQGGQLGIQRDAATLPYVAPQAEANLTGTTLSNADKRQGMRLDRSKFILDLASKFDSDIAVRAYKNSVPRLRAAMTAGNTPQDDISIIYAWAKVMDPDGAVMQGDVDLATMSGSVADKARELVARVTEGKGLPEGVRQGLVANMRNQVISYNLSYGEARTRFRSLADEAGIKPELVIGRHAGEPLKEVEQEWKRDNGLAGPKQNDLSLQSTGGLTPDGRSKVGVDASTRQEFNPKASAALDQLIRKGVPYASAVREMKDKFNAVAPDPRIYNEAVTHAKQNPGYRGSYGYVEDTRPLTALEQGRNAVAQWTPTASLGLYANAATAGLPQRLAGDQGTFAVESMRDASGGYGTAAEMGGAITGLVMGDKGLRAAAPYLGRFGQAMANNPFARQTGLDLSFGAAYGANTNPDDPLAGAMKGAAGAAAGSALGRYVVGPGIAAVGSTAPVRSVLDRGAGMFARRFDPPAALPGGERVLANQFTSRNGIDPNAVLGRLDEAAGFNLPLSLADTDPALRQLGGTVARKSPDALRLATDTFQPRALGQGERAITAINQQLAPVGDLTAIVQGTRQQAQNASRPMYERAMAQPAPEDAALADILRSPAAEQGAREAYSIALNRGENPAELSFIQGPDGPILQANPNWRTLQYIKMGLDTQVERMRNPVTGQLDLQNPATASLNTLRQRLNARMGELNPDYAAGNAAYSQFISQGDAATQGAAATAARVTPEDTQRALDGLSDAQRPFYQQGYASSLADTVERTSLSRNPLSTIYGSMGQQAKVGSVFPEGAPNFARIASLEDDMARTSTEVLGGSATQPRRVADEAFDAGGWGDGAFDLGMSAATGAPPMGLLARGAQRLNDARRVGVGRERADQIAPILFNTNPGEVADQLRQTIDLANRRRAYERRAGMFASGVLAPVGITLAQ